MVSGYGRSGQDAQDERGDFGSGPIAVLHSHINPITHAVAVGSWPCAQCIALGRTGPRTYISDGGTTPDGGDFRSTEIPPERLEAYLASFPREVRPPGRKARRKAEREARRGQRRTGGAR